MSGANHDQVYRAACEAAQVELNHILEEFQQLQLRRERIQKVTEALRPLVESAQQFIPTDPYPASKPAEPSKPVAVPVVAMASEVSSDPLQRQISFALGKVAVA